MLQMILMLGLTGTQAARTKVAQIQPCVWPKKCAVEKLVAFNDGPITTCEFPKKCGV